VAVALVAAVAACARPGDTPGGTPTTTVTFHASAAPQTSAGLRPVPASRLPQRPGLAACAQPAVAVPKPVPSPTGSARPRPDSSHPRGAGPNDAGERARQALEAAQSPIPRNGSVPADAAESAEQCVRRLQQEFTLRAAGSGRFPDEAAVRASLQSAGLLRPVVEPGPRFAASTGEACILGGFAAGQPAMTIAALPDSGTCRP
jgi:hypothetical protein